MEVQKRNGYESPVLRTPKSNICLSTVYIDTGSDPEREDTETICSAATTSQGDDMINNKKNDKNLRPKCTACATHLAGSTAYTCQFPSCINVFCKPCGERMAYHPDDGGVWGDLNLLRKKIAAEKGITTPELETETDGHTPQKPPPKKTIAVGAMWMFAQAQKIRKDQEFENRWGRQLN
jgi:hypothetical protein